MTIFDDNFWWQFSMTILMTIFHDNLWWQFFWTYFQLVTCDIWDTDYNTGNFWFHDNLCYLTITCDTGQHSQFLRCFTPHLPLTSDCVCRAGRIMLEQHVTCDMWGEKKTKFVFFFFLSNISLMQLHSKEGKENLSQRENKLREPLNIFQRESRCLFFSNLLQYWILNLFTQRLIPVSFIFKGQSI